MEAESSSSISSLVDRSLALVSVNTEILVFTLCGVIVSLVEVAGYWPTSRLKDLFPEQSEGASLGPELRTVIYKISDALDIARFYSVHIYLATYLLLPYPLLMEKQKVMLVPWLLCSVLRSLLLALLQSFAGVVLCSSSDNVHYRCLQYAVINGLEFSTSFFVWTTVHNFYHYLVGKKSEQDLDLVIKTIHKAGLRKAKERMKSVDSADQESSALSVDGLDEELLPGTEATLVERAAMAWIAREILEDDGEYVTDGQFSHLLAARATEELREVMRELAERRRDLPGRQSSVHRRINDSLEFYRKTSSHYEYNPSDTTLLPRLEAFDESAILSRRDPIRRIPPLIIRGRPFVEEDDSMPGEVSSLLEPWKVLPDSQTSAAVESSVQVQTDPLSPEMNQLLDFLDRQYAKQREKCSEHEKGKSD